jgi:hypothetical protein
VLLGKQFRSRRPPGRFPSHTLRSTWFYEEGESGGKQAYFSCFHPIRPHQRAKEKDKAEITFDPLPQPPPSLLKPEQHHQLSPRPGVQPLIAIHHVTTGSALNQWDLGWGLLGSPLSYRCKNQVTSLRLHAHPSPNPKFLLTPPTAVQRAEQETISE